MKSRWVGVVSVLVAIVAVCSGSCRGQPCLDGGDLFHDLMVVEAIDRRLNDRMPVTYNYFLHGGYFVMPSARMGCEGVLSKGYSYVPPYRNYNVGVQITDSIELSGNYRVFKGVPDPNFGGAGFGDLSDKGVNVKFAILHPEDSEYRLPGVAIGFEDFLGTRAFESRYLVFTHVFFNYNVEMSAGIGAGRLKGLFGGVLWMPFRCGSNAYLEGLALSAEYDATDYKDPDKEKHPDGRSQKSPINYGLKYRLCNLMDFAVSSIRGEDVAFSGSISYDFGHTEGFLPKIGDKRPYRSPVNTEPLGFLRPEEVMIQDFLYAMCEQGFILLEGWLSYDCCCRKVLRIKVYNTRYRSECEVWERMSHFAAFLTPSDISEVVMVMEGEGFPVHEYRFSVDALRRYRDRKIGDYELAVLSPLCEASFPDRCCDRRLFHQSRDLFNPYVRPDVSTVFGSSRGKFKYSLGLVAGSDGFLCGDIFYSLQVSYSGLSDFDKVGDVDILNPSQVINVRSDQMSYYHGSDLALEELFLQKNWNMGCGWFSRVGGGYFERAYGGAAGELLYHPVCSDWAVGMELAVLVKRNYSGLGFTDRVRKLEGFDASYRHFLGSQGFVDMYYDWREAKLHLKVSAGKFLANDWGARVEVARYFTSGLKLFIWYTRTSARDIINGERYHDKGVGFSMPLDIFYTQCSRRRWGYSMAAWLRDVGIRVETGRALYDMIHEHRQNW